MCAAVTWLYLDLDSYFASVEQHDNADLRGKPVAVLPGREISPGATCIAASYAAKAFGVRTGTKVAEARELCPDIVFCQARHDRYVTVHREVRAALETIIPVEAVCSIDEFSCRLLGPQCELETAIALASAAKERIYRSVGPALGCSIGVGVNPLLAKIAAEMDKPDGLGSIAPGEEREKLSRLSLTDLPGINRGMKARLERAGVETVAGLLDLAPRHARQIWNGVQGERFLRRLLGEDIPEIATKRGMIGHSQVLAPAARSSQNARLVARRLLTKAAARLRRMEYFSTRLSLGAKYHTGMRAGREMRFHATKDTLIFLKTMEEMWQTIPHNQPFKAVSVTLSGLVSDADHVADLFEERPASGILTQQEALFNAIDRLNQRYGRDTLTVGERPGEMAPYSGAKIAFNRIPEETEFRE